MKSTIDEPINLDEPHFDEEATILSARPVVPLDQVSETKRSKSGLALALAIGGGLIIGLLAATLIFRYLSVGEPSAVETTVAEQPAQVADQPSEQLPISTGGPVATVDEAPSKSIEDEKPPVIAEDSPEADREESRPAGTPNRSTEVPRPPVIVREAPRPADDEEVEEDEIERAMRRAERQEARRERRRAAREATRNRQDGQTNEDLSRIREIFEGTPKP